ncbi:hypothetical protein BD324DRAFT_613287 [Kockovaella imperatae]|uniref:TIGR02453 family protein n=1 Tax=Kockovaella imperatae TaxID=4999 RepID=A0A1Y1USX3_9TREE|nr:hypothetical protein BD324DRAFT_613287 [Kockovaella imperatae]ORX41119.1 hypothetical protein BD324DRAFT_613287 [Kockovaella imperatae]
MAITPRSTRSATRSSPRSIKSAKSASSKPSTPLKKVTTAKTSGKKAPTARTSPYFQKTSKQVKGKGKRTKRQAEEDGSEDDGDRADSPTGMTETPSSSDAEDSEDDFNLESDDAEEPEEEIESDVDSDFLDEEDVPVKKKSRPSNGSGKVPTSSSKGKGKAKRVEIDGYEDEEEEEDMEVELEEGQEIAGRIYPAPKTGQVPPGQISQNTLNFLKNLQIPERNDRDWFRSHEPAFRQAENEWKAFVTQVQMKFQEGDHEVPILPPKDVIHRIYRDVRFSSDKTPYKKSFSLSTSRGGRKGIWAGYHLSISPNDKSILACGTWQPGKNELASIRHRFLTDPELFREVISAPEFVEHFGPPKPHPKGKRQNVFGHDDALKVAPKGVDKSHKDIDLLKLRSIAVIHHFSDNEVLKKDFQDQVGELVRVMAPFVHLLNDFISVPAGDNDDDDEDENGNEDDD